MTNDNAKLGFRIVGSCVGERRLIEWSAAFAAHCLCGDRIEGNHEAYLSAFTFPNEFSEHLDRTRSTKGYAGYCGASWLWFDIDSDELGKATGNARRLCAGIATRYGIDADELLIFFSGSKGYHVGIPTTLLNSPPPSAHFHKVVRRFAVSLKEQNDVTIDTGIYDRVRAFRAPNSLHPKTELHKRRLTFDELLHLNVDALVRLARVPEAFELPKSPPANSQAVIDWQAATEAVERDTAALAERCIANPAATLNRQTREFIIDGAAAGDRHRLLFSAAANLGEFGCSSQLAHALLTESALDSGLTPSQVRRQIDCGLGAKGDEHGS